MSARSKSGFVIPFTLGTAFGVISGVTLGALLGHRLFTAMLDLWSFFGHEGDQEPPFDLLLQ